MAQRPLPRARAPRPAPSPGAQARGRRQGGDQGAGRSALLAGAAGGAGTSTRRRPARQAIVGAAAEARGARGQPEGQEAAGSSATAQATCSAVVNSPVLDSARISSMTVCSATPRITARSAATRRSRSLSAGPGAITWALTPRGP